MTILNNDGLIITKQDLSTASPNSGDDGRLYSHDGSSSISLINGNTTTNEGYFMWDESAQAWSPLKFAGIDSDYVNVSGDTMSGNLDMGGNNITDSSTGSLTISGNTNISSGQLSEQGNRVATRTWVNTNFDNYVSWTVSDGDGTAETAPIGSGETFAINGGSGVNTELDTNEDITVNHNDTSTQGNVSAAAGAAITDVNVDGFGHVTSLGTTDFDSRFYNEGQDLTGTSRVGGSGLFFDFNNSSGYIELVDGNGARDQLVTEDVYINEDGTWLGDHLSTDNAHNVGLEDARTTDSTFAGNVGMGGNTLSNVGRVQFGNTEFSDAPGEATLGFDNSEGLKLRQNSSWQLIIDENGNIHAHNSQQWEGYDLQKNGTDGTGVINFKT